MTGLSRTSWPFSLEQIFSSRFANLLRRRARARREFGHPSRGRLEFEPLENRLLLSADLIGGAALTTLTDPLIPGDVAQATVLVENIGNAAKTGAVHVDLYASLDSVLDPHDILLDSERSTGRLAPGASRSVAFEFSLPDTMQPGDYSLISVVDSRHELTEDNETNNVSVASGFSLEWMFGAVPGRASSQVLEVRDADGTLVQFSLIGAGTGEITVDGGQWDLLLTGTNSESLLSIDAFGGDNRFALDDIHATASLGALVAPTMDLTGTLAVQGPLGAGLVIGSAQDAVIAAPAILGIDVCGFSLGGIKILGNLGNSQVLIGADLGDDGRLGGSGVDADSFGPGSIGFLGILGSVSSSFVRAGQDPVNGVFDDCDDIIQGGEASRIGVIAIGGELSSDSRIIAGTLPALALVDGRLIHTAGDARFKTDVHGPEVELALANDTGGSAMDRLTFDPTISGTATDPSGIVSLRAGFGASASVDIMAELGSDGSFLLSQSDLEGIFGAALIDGTYTLTIEATDGQGNTCPHSLTFALDATAPTVTIDQAMGQEDPTTDSPIGFTVVFSEAVAGFTGADVDLAGSSAGGTLVASVAGTGPSYTVTVTGMDSTGTVIAAIPDGAALDLAGNANRTSTSTDNAVSFLVPANFSLAFLTPASSVDEAGGPASLTVVLTTDAPLSGSVTVDLAALGIGSATPGADYSFASPTTLTFAAGSVTGATQSAVVGISDDRAVEASTETAGFSFGNIVVGGADANVGAATGSHTLEISDNDSASVAITTPGATILREGGASANVGVTLTLTTSGTTGTAQLDVPLSATLPGNADYTATPVVFAAGAVSGATANVVVSAVNDLSVEQSTESFAGQALSATSTASASASTAQTIDVTDNDSASVAITTPDTTSVSEGGAGANVGVTLMLTTSGTTGTAQLEVPVSATLSGNADYVATPAVFAAGAVSGATANVVVSAVNDLSVEQSTESFAGQVLSATSTASASASTSQTIDVTDNDSASVAITSPGTTSVTEGGASANVGVTLTLTTSGTTGTAQLEVPVSATLSGNADYTATPAVFAAGAVSGATANVVVSAVNDLSVEQSTESFAGQALSATSTASASASTSQTIDVTDNDSASVAITTPGTTSVSEGGAGANVGVTLTLTTSGTTGTAQLDVPLSATLPGNADYTATPAVFAAGAVSGATANVVVSAVNDLSVEQSTESFAGQALSATSTASASVSTSQTIDVTDNDSASVAITTPGTTSVTEGGAAANVGVTLMLTTSGTTGTAQLEVPLSATLSGNADYTATPAVFAAGAVSGATANVVVSAVDDLNVEQSTESFPGQALSATSTASASASTSQTIDVTDNDSASVAITTPGTTSVSEGGAAANVGVTLTLTTSGTTGTAQLDVPLSATLSGNADYTATPAVFAAGAVSGATANVVVSAVNDGLFEPTETFPGQALSVTSTASASASTSQTIDVIDNIPPTVSINQASGQEDPTSDGPIRFTVVFSEAVTGFTDSDVDLSASTAGGTLMASVAGTGASYTVTVTGMVTTGTVVAAIPDGAALDAAGNASRASTSFDNMVTFSTTPRPFLFIGDATVVERDSVTFPATVTFTVSLSAPSELPVSAFVDARNGTAVEGTDFRMFGGSVSFAPGVTTDTVTVEVLGDTAIEADEFFYLNLESPTNAILSDWQGFGTIIDNDGGYGLTINDVTLFEAGNGTTEATFTVYLPNPSSVPVSVNFTTRDGSARAGTDYVSTSGTLTIAPGATQSSFTVPVLGDSEPEVTEDFSVLLSGAVNALISDPQGVATILSDDRLSRLAISEAIVLEGASGTTNAAFTVTLSAPASVPVSVNFETQDGPDSAFGADAVAPGDYTATSGAIAFAPGVTSQTILVPVAGDLEVEGDEWFHVRLSNAVGGATLFDSQVDHIGQATIVNDDRPPPELSSRGGFVIEGNSGTTNALLTVFLTHASPMTVTVDYETFNAGTNEATAGTDYTPVSGTLTFAPGVTTQTISVPVIGDTTSESIEDIGIRYTNEVNVDVSIYSIIEIIDNDGSASLPVLSVRGMGLVEGDSGTTNAIFTALLSKPSTVPVSFNFQTSDVPPAIFAFGRAIAGEDYASTGGTLTFAPGETIKTIAVPIVGDLVPEDDEIFQLNVSGFVGLTQDVSGPRYVKIFNDDQSLSLGIADAVLFEPTSGTSDAVFSVVLSRPATSPITVNYATTGVGGATAGSDYAATSGSLTFAPGTTTRSFAVPVFADALVESREIFHVQCGIEGGSGGFSAFASILDNSRAPQLAIDGAMVIEGDSSAQQALFAVYLSEASTVPVTVNYATADGSATAAADYSATSGTLMFAPGTTRQTISVPVAGDRATEGIETFTVRLSGEANARLTDSSGTGTIVDNDPPQPLPQLRIGDVSVEEGDSGAVNAVFTVNLSAAATAPITFRYETANGTARAGSDYIAANTHLTFAAGTTSQTITIPIIPDTTIEADETFWVRFTTTPTNAAVADNFGVGTIVSDDLNTPPIAHAGGPYVVELGTSLTLDGNGSVEPDAAFGDSIVSYEWVINDSLQLSGVNPTLSAEQIDVLGVSTNNVRLTVADEFGGVGVANATLTVYRNEPIEAGSGFLMAAEGSVPLESALAISTTELESVAAMALDLWGDILGWDSARLAPLSGIEIGLADLGGAKLGHAEAGRILIDSDGAGYGWYIHPILGGSGPWEYGAMDLLSVVMHEFGHVLGFDHESGWTVMQETLAPGARYTIDWNAKLDWSFKSSSPFALKASYEASLAES